MGVQRIQSSPAPAYPASPAEAPGNFGVVGRTSAFDTFQLIRTQPNIRVSGGDVFRQIFFHPFQTIGLLRHLGKGRKEDALSMLQTVKLKEIAAKARGKNQYVVYEGSLGKTRLQRLELLEALRASPSTSKTSCSSQYCASSASIRGCVHTSPAASRGLRRSAARQGADGPQAKVVRGARSAPYRVRFRSAPAPRPAPRRRKARPTRHR